MLCSNVQIKKGDSFAGRRLNYWTIPLVYLEAKSRHYKKETIWKQSIKFKSVLPREQTYPTDWFVGDKYVTVQRWASSEPSLAASGRRTTYWRTSSSFFKLNNLRIFDARFGPRRRGIVVSVSPGISCSPAHTMSTRPIAAVHCKMTYGVVDGADWTAWHLPLLSDGPVGLVSSWTATSNVEVGQTRLSKLTEEG